MAPKDKNSKDLPDEDEKLSLKQGKPKKNPEEDDDAPGGAELKDGEMDDSDEDDEGKDSKESDDEEDWDEDDDDEEE